MNNKLVYLQYALLGIALAVLLYVALHDPAYVEHPTELEIRVDDGDYMLVLPEASAAAAAADRAAPVEREEAPAAPPPAQTETTYDANAAMDS